MQRAPDGIIAAYQGYDAIFARGHATEVGCWAHTRRKFFEAQTSDPARAAEMLVRIGDLYAVEHRAKEENLDREQIKLRRQKESRPILGVSLLRAEKAMAQPIRITVAGMLNINSSLAVTDCTFSNNSAGSGGIVAPLAQGGVRGQRQSLEEQEP